MQNLRVVFCLPGSNFSGNFLDSWSNLLIYCIKQGIQFAIQRRESSVVHFVRAMCLGADVLRGENQKPFDGKINYTHLMWIDSDTIFEPQDFQKLLDDDKDIVCGLYPMQNGKNYVVVKDWDEDYFKKNGSFHFLENSEIPTNLFECVYAGMGFMLVKKGVFESIRYPWFQPINTRIKANPDIVEFTSEDVAFCLKAAENGYKIWVDPIIRVGHEKKIVIR